MNILSNFSSLALPFVIYAIMKIWRKRLTEGMSDEAVHRTAPATRGLLKTTNNHLVRKPLNFQTIRGFSVFKGI